jgi:hypothetical protein
MTSIKPQIDLSHVVARFAATSDVSLERRTNGGTFRDGRWHEPSPSTAALVANVQPASMSQMTQVLNEGERVIDGISIHSTSELVPTGRTPANRGDTIVWQGRRYEVISVEDWNTNGRYWSAIAVRNEQ